MVRAARFSADVLSSIAVLRADRVVPAAVVVMASARRVVLRERQAHGVRCIRHAPRRVGLQEHVLASASVPAWERVPASVLAAVSLPVLATVSVPVFATVSVEAEAAVPRAASGAGLSPPASVVSAERLAAVVFSLVLGTIGRGASS